MQDDIGDMPEYEDSDSSGIELTTPTTAFGPFPTAEDIQKHGPFWELKSAAGRTLRVKFEDGRTERCRVKTLVARMATKVFAISAEPAWRTHSVGSIDPGVVARPVGSFDTLLGVAPFYFGSVVRCKTSGTIGLVAVSSIRSFSSTDSLHSLFNAKYTYRISWCEKHSASVSPVDEAELEFLGCPDRFPPHDTDLVAQYFAELKAKYSSSYPIRGGSCGSHEVGGITYKYNVSYIKEAADKPWTVDSARTQEFMPAADGPTVAAITAHVLAQQNNHPDVRIGYVAIKA